MPFAVLPASIKDIGQIYDVYFEAFRGELINKIFFPQGTDDEAFRKYHATAVLDWWHKSDFDCTFKCIDTRSNKIVGMAIWSVFSRRRDAAERQKPEIGWLQGMERTRAEAFAIPFWEMKEKLFGDRPYIYCHVLAVRPSFQRKGIGQSLTQWGIQLAEQMSLPIYLESTITAIPLYKKMAFTALEHGVHLGQDVTEGDEDLEAPIFIRMPSSASYTSFSDFDKDGATYKTSTIVSQTEYLCKQLRA